MIHVLHALTRARVSVHATALLASWGDMTPLPFSFLLLVSEGESPTEIGFGWERSSDGEG